MISVIRSLLHDPGKMRRVFFFWTVRDNSSFAWFSDLMDEIYEQDSKNILEIRHFITSLKRDDRDFGDVLFHYAANAVHADTNLDIYLGQRTHHQIEVGRPEWDKELRHVVNITREIGETDCGIFLCGPERMADDVRQTSQKLSVQCPDVHLYFSKETF
jgi:ferredoxin-NADP reductase